MRLRNELRPFTTPPTPHLPSANCVGGFSIGEEEANCIDVSGLGCCSQNPKYDTDYGSRTFGELIGC